MPVLCLHLTPGNIFGRSGNRIDLLRQTQERVKFLPLEPLVGQIINMNLSGIDWVIVGGESGPGARPMQEDWVTEIRDQCLAANVKFFFKQWGGVRKQRTERVLDGRTWDEMPQFFQSSIAVPLFRTQILRNLKSL